MNPLFDLKPFRHQLLEQLQSNPKLRGALIPLLEKDIVNDPALIGFIEKYCKEEGAKLYATGLDEAQKTMMSQRGFTDEGMR